MAPFFTINNPPNGRLAHSVASSDLSLALPTHKSATDSNYLGSGEFSLRSLLSTIAATLVSHVFGIVMFCTKPKMVRVYASRIVPIRAIMQYAKTAWNWSKMQQPRGTVRPNTWSGVIGFNHSVAIGFGCRPQPAALGFINFRPKTFWEACAQTLRSKVLRGNLDLRIHSGPFALTVRRASLLYQFSRREASRG